MYLERGSKERVVVGVTEVEGRGCVKKKIAYGGGWRGKDEKGKMRYLGSATGGVTQ